MIYAVSVGAMAVVWMAIIVLNEKYNLLSCDRFSSAAAKWFAYLWLGLLFLLMAVLITAAALNPARGAELERAPFYSLFGIHAILVIFLTGWWLATGRPRLTEFFNIQLRGSGEAVMIGLAAGVGGWLLALAGAALIAIVLKAGGLLSENPMPSQMIGFMATMVWWKKVLIVFSAMTVEEAFFRGWLQKRLGLLASTTLFTLPHLSLGQPLLLIGVAMISLVIGFTFYRTRSLLPPIIAHGVFNAIQLFVIIPIAVKLPGLG